MKKTKVWAILFMAVLTLGAVCACSSDDDDDKGGGSNAVTSHILGNWLNGGMMISFSSNGTGLVTNSFNETKYPNGSFDYGAPYEIETGESKTWFLINVTYTSGDYRGKTINWEIGYSNTEGETESINVEGTNFNAK